MITASLLDPILPTWNSTIVHLYHRLGESDQSTLFPLHFLQTTLPRIGGQVALFQTENRLVGVGLLFPRLGATEDAPVKPSYTLRLQRLPATEQVDFTLGCRQLSEELGGAEIILYDPTATLHFDPTHTSGDAVDIGRPAAHEAVAIRQLQQQVWGSSAASLYPADIHSVEFGLGTSLVARREGTVVGFLFGFDKIGHSPLPADWQTRFHGQRRIESQTLGVHPAHRGARLGFLLKRAQAQQARQRHIQVVNWTVDPLQWPNAQLNFGQLRALAFAFMPDYYAFRNELNRLPASRFGITWLIDTPRVQGALADGQVQRLDLPAAGAIQIVNHGWQRVVEQVTAPQVAIEIPANWTALQQTDLAAAIQWRATTDQIFQRLIGAQPDQYVVTGVGLAGEKRYLLAEQVTASLWERLEQPSPDR